MKKCISIYGDVDTNMKKRTDFIKNNDKTTVALVVKWNYCIVEGNLIASCLMKKWDNLVGAHASNGCGGWMQDDTAEVVSVRAVFSLVAYNALRNPWLSNIGAKNSNAIYQWDKNL